MVEDVVHSIIDIISGPLLTSPSSRWNGTHRESDIRSYPLGAPWKPSVSNQSLRKIDQSTMWPGPGKSFR